MIRIDTLFDEQPAAGIPGGAPPDLLTDELRAFYGGALSFPWQKVPDERPYLFSNFVSSLDGVVSYAESGRSSGAEISGSDRGDRFIMGTLRACADAVVVGAETVAAEGGLPRTAEAVYPDGMRGYAALRQARGKPPHPLNVILTRSGKIDPSLPIFDTPALEFLVFTTTAGKRAIDAGGGIPAQCVVALGDDRVDPADVAQRLRGDRGVDLCLVEGGPTILGQFISAGLLDEMFLTWSPRVAGRGPQHPRPGMVQSAAFTPDNSPAAELISLKRHENFLFTRYRLR